MKPIRRKENPEKHIFTGKPSSDSIEMQLYVYNKDSLKESKDLSLDSIKKFVADGNYYWLNIYGLHDADLITALCKKEGVHDLVIQDILDINQRPKFQEDQEYSFLTLKSISQKESIVTEQISFILGGNFLISFQEQRADYFNHIRKRLRDNLGSIREHSPDYLLYTMLESILDNYFTALDKLDQEIESISFLPSQIPLEKIEQGKKLVHYIKRAILPIKEFAQSVEHRQCRDIKPEQIKYFLEIKDLSLTLIDSCDTILYSLESKTNLFFSIQGEKMNQIMKTLTVVTSTFIPLTFIAGVYGMNFKHIPELEWRYGYFAVWIVMVLLFIGMLLFFRKKRWF